MIDNIAATTLPAAVCAILAVALITRSRNKAACALTLSLPAMARFPDPDLVSGYAATLIDAGALALFLNTAVRCGERCAMMIAAMALIAVIAGILAHAGIGLALWQHRLITLSC